MAYDIEQREASPQPVLSVRAPVKFQELMAKVGEFVGEVFQHLQQQGAQPAGPPFTRYHGVSGDEVDLEAGLPVAQQLAGSGRVSAGELPGGPVVSTTHQGSYDDLTKAGEALAAWVSENGRQPAGANWEVYWVAPGQNADPSSWKTEVVKPLRPA